MLWAKRSNIGSALLRGMQLLETNDIRGLRRVIDLSADSANNWSGPPIEEARAVVLSKGITINGLAILCRDVDCGGRPVAYNLEEAFQRDIVGGPGAFVVTAGDMQSFAAAVKRKLILEIAGEEGTGPGSLMALQTGSVQVAASPDKGAKILQNSAP